MRCHSCDFENPNGAKFCAQCGIRIETSCPECGHIVAPSYRYCVACGTMLNTDDPISTDISGITDEAPWNQAREEELAEDIPTFESEFNKTDVEDEYMKPQELIKESGTNDSNLLENSSVSNRLENNLMDDFEEISDSMYANSITREPETEQIEIEDEIPIDPTG